MLIGATLFLVALAIALVCGCGRQEDVNARMRLEQVGDDSVLMDTYVLVDTETGCQYLIVDTSSSEVVTLLVDKYGYPLLADGHSRTEVGMSRDEGE